MGRYIARRLLWVLLVVVLVTFATFRHLLRDPAGGSGDPLCRPGPERAAHRRSPPFTRPRPFLLGPIRAVPQAHLLGRPVRMARIRTLIRHPLPDPGELPRPGRNHRPTRPRGGDDMAHHGGVHRHHLGPETRQVAGPAGNGLRPLRGLRPRLLARSDVALHLLGEAALAARDRATSPSGRDPSQWFLHFLLPWVVLALLFAAFYARMVRGASSRPSGRTGCEPPGPKGSPSARWSTSTVCAPA